jgi:hypothetical protein
MDQNLLYEEFETRMMILWRRQMPTHSNEARE